MPTTAESYQEAGRKLCYRQPKKDLGRDLGTASTARKVVSPQRKAGKGTPERVVESWK